MTHEIRLARLLGVALPLLSTAGCTTYFDSCDPARRCAGHFVCESAVCVPGRVLTVQLAGNGSGTVISSPGDIQCPGTCEAIFPVTPPKVVLTATAAEGSRFEGWSSGDCGGTGGCTVQPLQDTTVTSVFTRVVPVVVTLAGEGHGFVQSTPLGVDCPQNACSLRLPPGASLTLTAYPERGSRFGQWFGACTGTEACVLQAEQPAEVTARFDLATP